MSTKAAILVFSCFVVFSTWSVFHASAQTTPEPRYFAFVVGVSDYYSKTMEDLSFAAKDATDVGDELQKLGYDVTRCVGREASREQIVGQFEAFLKKLAEAQIEPHDVVLILFSGHGQELPTRVEPEGQAAITEAVPYFCAWDAVAYDEKQHTLAGLRAEAVEEKLGLVSINRILGGLEKSNSLNNLLIVDACRSNPAKGKAPQITGSTIRQLPQGISMLFAARSGQKSYESVDPNVRNGVFTHYLLQGLRGEAKNSRGQITWMRLVTKVSEDVPGEGFNLAGGKDLVQSPHFVNNSDANIILSRRVLPKVLVAPFDTATAKSGQAAWAAHLGIEVSTKNSVDMQMILIPPGEFMMGSADDDETAYDNEKPQHRVTLTNAFLMAETEVTQVQWKAVMGTEPWKETESVKEGANYPATYVSWDDAEEFCRRLSEKECRTYRLPTEAEWEYACRAGTTTKYHFGNDESALGRFAWYNKNTWDVDEKYAHLVRHKQSNPFGLYDMHGNVWEWCSDWYGWYRSESQVNPSGPEPDWQRMHRGGDWIRTARDCRAPYRVRYTPSLKSVYGGFRPVSVSQP